MTCCWFVITNLNNFRGVIKDRCCGASGIVRNIGTGFRFGSVENHVALSPIFITDNDANVGRIASAGKIVLQALVFRIRCGAAELEVQFGNQRITFFTSILKAFDVPT